jgi:imidazoleglycerol phosphate dehydratase HisB
MAEERTAQIRRETGETKIELRLNLDGQGNFSGETGLGFLDHMLHLTARHARFDLDLRAEGDLQTDEHHLVEDIGIVFGQALSQAVGDKKGIERYGWAMLPMDEVLVAVALDLGGRFAYCSDYQPQRERVGDLPTELIGHFFQSIAVEGRLNLHIRFLNPGQNEHHRVEALFKAFARALKMAVRIDPKSDQVPSTKGVL